MKTHEEGLAVLLEVSLIGIHHAVQPWQQFPEDVNDCYSASRIMKLTWRSGRCGE
jgi:hypothetical protein